MSWDGVRNTLHATKHASYKFYGVHGCSGGGLTQLCGMCHPTHAGWDCEESNQIWQSCRYF